MYTEISVVEFLKVLGYEDDDYLCVSNAKGKEISVKLKDYNDIKETLREMNSNKDQIYFVVNKPEPKAKDYWVQEKGKYVENSDIKSINAHFVEIDGHIPAGLTREDEAKVRGKILEEQKEKILSFPVKPTVMITTRKSIHVYWVVTDESIKGFSENQDRLNAYFDADTNVRDPKRLMRLPGFQHNKCNYEYPIEIIWYETEHRYSIEELFRDVPQLEKKTAEKSVHEGCIKYGVHRLASCEFIKNCWENAKTLPEPKWHALAGQLKVFYEGRECFHAISKSYDKDGNVYDAYETNNKFDSYCTGPMRCETIFDKTGFQCPKYGTCPAKSPAELYKYPIDMEDSVGKLPADLPVTKDENTINIRNKCLKFIEKYLYNYDAGQAKEFIKVNMKEHINSICGKGKGIKSETLDSLIENQAVTYKKFRENMADSDKSGVLEEEPQNIMSDEEMEAAMGYLKDPRLIDNIVRDLEEAGGLKNEDENKLMIYFAATSRKMDKPISLNALAQSGAGKSHLVNTVAAFMPPEDVVMFTSVSPKAFDHMAECDINHKFIALQEIEGVEDVLPTIRIMQSENFLERAYVAKDEQTGFMKTVSDRKECKSSIVFTTTRTKINDENSTRVFSLYMDESKEQTRKIVNFIMDTVTLEYEVSENEREMVRKLHQNVQRLLKPMKVVIPFSKYLKGKFPSYTTRHRRDCARFLEVIKVIAFLFQYQKEIKVYEGSEGTMEYIEADLSDYYYAYKIGGLILQKGLSSIDEREVAVLNVIKKFILAGFEKEKKKCSCNPKSYTDITFKRKDIEKAAEGTSVDAKNRDNLNRILNSLLAKEYLSLESDGVRGETYTYRSNFDIIGEEIVLDSISQLLTPQELKEKLDQEKLGANQEKEK